MIICRPCESIAAVPPPPQLVWATEANKAWATGPQVAERKISFSEGSLPSLGISVDSSEDSLPDDLALEDSLDSASFPSFPMDIEEEEISLDVPLLEYHNVRCKCIDYRKVDIALPKSPQTLHDICFFSPNDTAAVRTALNQDMFQAGSPRHCPICGYHYPLHIAIFRRASKEVLRLLIEAGPWILFQEDGPRLYTPLGLALAISPQAVDLHAYLLGAEPLAATLPNSEAMEYPLHVACQQGAPTETLLMLVLECGEAVYHKNRQGQTPFDIMEGQEEILGIFFCLGKRSE